MLTSIKNYANRIMCFFVFLILLSCQDSTQIQSVDSTDVNNTQGSTNTDTNSQISDTATDTNQGSVTNTQTTTNSQTQTDSQTNTNSNSQTDTQTNTQVVFPVEGQLENVAINKLASQSSTNYGGESSFAVDGNTNGTYNDGSVSHTSNESQAWWEVDLESEQAISYINIFNRTDECCSARLADFYVLVSSTPFESTQLNESLNQESVSAFYYESAVNDFVEIDVSTFGQYVRIQLTNEDGPLSLAEVEVMAYLQNTPIETETQTDTQTDDTTYICPDMQTLLADLTCTNSQCHSATPGQAAKVSLVGSIEDLAYRFNDVQSVNSNCSDEKVIDTLNPSNSLMLKLVNPHSGDQCSFKMPIGSDGVSEDHFGCFETWVEEIAAVQVDIEEPEVEPFVALDGFGSLNKVKSLLHGAAVSDSEMNEVLEDNGDLNQDALRASIESWMQTEEFEIKMSDFLQLTLQQKNESVDDSYRATLDVVNNNLGLGNFLGVPMRENIEEGFVRTAMRFVKEGQDFRQIATTTTWDVTTSVLVALAYADYQNRRPFLNDETNPGILRQYEYIEDSDFSDWRRVTFTKSEDNAYFDLGDPNTAANLRAIPDGGQLALRAPRVGYFTTISFLQNWISNAGNKFRVTINQTLLTGLGLTFEGGDITEHGDLAGLDVEHAGADECFACHRLMDPMAQVFRNYFKIDGNRPLDTVGDTQAAFAFQGYSAPLEDIYDLAQAIHDHPNFSTAWVGKLCNWATSTVCDTQSEEFKRIVGVFESSDYNMSDVIVELFSSPLVTYSQYIDGIQPAPAVVLNRTNHFCRNMQARLTQIRVANGLDESNSTDLCNLSGGVQEKVGLLAQDEFARGSADLIQAVTLDPFITSGYKQLCEESQNFLISYGAGTEGPHYNKFFNANEVALAIENMTSFIMGFPPSHTQHDFVKDSLQKMYDIHSHETLCADTNQHVIDANANEVVCGLGDTNRSNVLKKVWIAACSSPSTVGMGF